MFEPPPRDIFNNPLSLMTWLITSAWGWFGIGVSFILVLLLFLVVLGV